MTAAPKKATTPAEKPASAPEVVPAPIDHTRTPDTPFGMALPPDGTEDQESDVSAENPDAVREARKRAYEGVKPEDRGLVTGLLAERRGYVQRQDGARASKDNATDSKMDTRIDGIDDELDRLGYQGDR